MQIVSIQFNTSKIGHLIWAHFPVLPISLAQQTAWKWQTVSQTWAGAAAETLIPPHPEKEWKFEIIELFMLGRTSKIIYPNQLKVFNLEIKQWHSDFSIQVLHPLLNWITYPAIGTTGKLGHGRHPQPTLMSFFGKIICSFWTFLQVNWFGMEGSRTCSLMVHRVAVLKKFLRLNDSEWVPSSPVSQMAE